MLLLGTWRKQVHEWRNEGSLLPENPTKVTWYPCLLRDSAWYCIRGLRPRSPRTSTQTRRSVPSSRRRNHSDASPVATARDTTGHVTPEPGANKAAETEEITANATRIAAPVERVAMFVCGGWWRGSAEEEELQFKGTADFTVRLGTDDRDGISKAVLIYYFSTDHSPAHPLYSLLHLYTPLITFTHTHSTLV